MSGLFGDAPRPPQPPPPTPMPDINDPSVLAARQRLLSAQASQTGRSSTILTGGGTGGQPTDYTSRTLGAA